MKILIAIPSKGRFGKDQIHKWTYFWLQHTKYDYKIFVEKEDYDEYIQSGIPKSTLELVDKSNKGLGYAKKCIQKYAIKNGYDIVFKCDDDINWTFRGSGGRKTTPKDRCEKLFDPMIKNSLNLFENGGSEIGAVSLTYGGGHYKTSEIEMWMKLNRRINTCYIIRTDLLCPPDGDKIFTYEDFYTFLNLRMEGFITVEYGLTGILYEPIGGNEGGIQTFNRRQKAFAAKEFLDSKIEGIRWRDVGKEWQYEPDLRFTKIENLKWK